jgi:hypothetical protein
MTELERLQAAAGATFATMNGKQIPATFGNDEAAWTAAYTGVAIADRSHWGRIRVTDSDRIRFLHNQTTNNFQQLQPGQGCDTVFVNSTARTLDLATAYVTEDAVLLLTSPHQQQALMEFMDRYIFFADKVVLTDVTAETAAFSLTGPGSLALLQGIGLTDLPDQRHQHQTVELDGMTVQVAVGNGLAMPGFTLMTAAEQAASLWQKLTEAGAMPMGKQVWQRLRISQGRPMPGHELTEDYNPLEAGLWHTVSFDKGCYIGQETIARLQTYQGVKQQLWGIALNAIAPAESPILLNGEKVGKLTSVVETPDGVIGLAYIRTKAGGIGLTVTVGEATGEIHDVPFLSHGYLAAETAASSS